MNFLKKYSLKKQLLYSVALGFVLFTMTMIYISSRSLEEAMLSEAQYNAEKEALKSINLVKTTLDEGYSVARTLTDALVALKKSGKEMPSRQEFNRVLEQQLANNPKLLAIGTLWEANAYDGKDSQFIGKEGHDNTGRYIPYITREDKGNFLLEALVDYETPGAGDYYLLPKRLKKEVILEPYIYKVNGVDTLITTLAVPILIDGEVVGEVCIDISLAFLQKLTDETNIFGRTGKMLILSNKGSIAGFTGHSELIQKSIFEIEQSNYVNLKKERFTDVSNFVFDEHNLSVVSPFSPGRTEFNWYVEVLIPKDVILDPIKKAQLSEALMAIAISSLLLFALYLVIRSADNILKNASETLKKAALSTKDSAQDLVQQSQILAAASVENAAATQESVASISEIGAMVSLTKQRTLESTQLLAQVADTTKEGVGLIANLNTAMNEIDKANVKLVNFSSIIKNIEDKTKVINDIVFKTQLLSFNASIEAARAGQHGRGFAIVAEEVGSLADLSGKAAKDIAELLSQSSGEVDSVVQYSTSAIKQGKEVSTSVTHSFNEISSSMESVLGNISNIQEATSEQSIGLAEVERAMKALEQTAHDSSTANEKFNKLAHESDNNAKRILKVSDQIDNIVYDQNVTLSEAPIKTSKKEVIKLSSSMEDTETYSADDDSFRFSA